MIKSFKYFTLFVFALVASFILSSNVFAFTNGEYIGHDYYSRPITTIKGGVTGGVNYTLYLHHTNYNGSNYDLYCLDPARRSGGSNASLKVSRVLSQNNAKDAVILTIISAKGYSQTAKTIAIRAFLPFTGDLSTSITLKGREYTEAIANANSGIKWALQDKESMKAIFKLSRADQSDLIAIAKLYKKYNSSLVMNESKGEVKSAKELFLKGLKAGADVAQGKTIAQKNVISSTPAFNDTKDEVKEIDGVRYLFREVNYTLTFTGFNDKSSDPVTLTINPDKNGKVETNTLEYQVLGSDEWVKYEIGTNIKPILTSKSVTLKFRHVVSAKVGATEPEKIKYYVNVDYKDEDILSGALVYNSRSTNPATQRFYIGDTEPGRHAPFENEIEWDQCTRNVPDKNNTAEFKEYLNKCCRNTTGFNITDQCTYAKQKGIQEEIDLYCNLQKEYCDYCNDKVTVPATCSEFKEGEFAVDASDREGGKAAEINGPEDIKVCVLDGVDQSNNSYKLTKEVKVDNDTNYTFKDNKYCNVYCKEDYKLDLPAGRYTISGRYFVLSMVVDAKKTCYTDQIDYNTFKTDHDNYKSIIETHIKNGTATGSNSEFVNALDSYNKAITDIKACSIGWDNKYNVDPEISFNYDEEYIDRYFGKDTGLKFVKQEDEKTSTQKWFCNGTDIDNKYENCIGASATTEATTTQVAGLSCHKDKNGNTYSCDSANYDIPTTKYAKVSTNVAATYAPDSIFYTKYSTGVIEVAKNAQGITELSANKKYTVLEEYLDSKIDDSIKIKTGALAVSLKDNRGVYNYNLKFKGLGEYFDKNANGRLVHSDTETELAADGNVFKGTYVCAYVVNCPECGVTCKEDPKKRIFCNITDAEPSTPEEIECLGNGCAFDSTFGELYSVHQTSLTNFNPTGRELGANLTTQKGEALIESIQAKGESIYDDPEYSFVFTPAAISFLREDVNKKSTNGYLGEVEGGDLDMTCKLYSDMLPAEEAAKIVGTDEDYTICTSGVLDVLEQKYNAVKVHSLKDSRSKIMSWKNSDYCKNGNRSCVVVGAVGPAWK